MRTVNELLEAGLNATKLNILVFGPQVSQLSSDPRTRNLQDKRVQIRDYLTNKGHIVRYAEDLVDPNLPSAKSNSFLQEIVIMPEYDLIVVLVDSPGSLIETGLIARDPKLAIKASLFLDSSYSEGLPAEACRLAKTLGADFTEYTYPKDLIECNLLGMIRGKVDKVQLIKLMS